VVGGCVLLSGEVVSVNVRDGRVAPGAEAAIKARATRQVYTPPHRTTPHGMAPQSNGNITLRLQLSSYSRFGHGEGLVEIGLSGLAGSAQQGKAWYHFHCALDPERYIQEDLFASIPPSADPPDPRTSCLCFSRPLWPSWSADLDGDFGASAVVRGGRRQQAIRRRQHQHQRPRPGQWQGHTAAR
jgi:hypothetical protein